MKLSDRLRRALDESSLSETIRLDGDDRGIPFAGPPTLMPAAVLMAITDRSEPGVLLTVRNAALRRHAGQVAFPGGRIDPGDGGPIEAALREAEEEIGLPPSEVDVIGAVDSYSTGTGFDVTPVIGVVPPDLSLVPHAAEVAVIFEAPLLHLLEPANFVEQTLHRDGREHHYFELMWDGHRIWGATAAMILNIGRRLAGRL
jgi:8-oxo-dGTP pyrophosphatase MutT (NUDIX family)